MVSSHACCGDGHEDTLWYVPRRGEVNYRCSQGGCIVVSPFLYAVIIMWARAYKRRIFYWGIF